MNISEYLSAGLSIIPVTQDKLPYFKLLPNGKWDRYKTHPPSMDEVKMWSQKATSFAVICGKVSGNLEIIDIDNHKGNAQDTYETFREIVIDHYPEIWEKLFIETSQSGGYHLIYRHNGKTEGSHKLAMQQIGEKRDTLIETKGEGGYVIVYPSPGYVPLKGSLTTLNILTDEERYFLFAVARSFNQIPEQEITHHKFANNQQIARPGDIFNESGEHKELLESVGWTLVGIRKEVEYWRRPDKNKGISATFNHVPNKLYVFSSNAAPFDIDRTYDKFAIYTQIKCGGDFKYAAKKVKEDYPHLFANSQGNVLVATKDKQPKANGTSNYNINDVQFPPHTIFWYEISDARGKPKLLIKKANLINFLEHHGYGKLWLDKNISRFVKIKDHIVTEETPETIVDFVKKTIQKLPDGHLTDNFTKNDIWETLLSQISKIKSKDFLETLKSYDIQFIRDTADTAFFFFKNGIVEVTKSAIILKPYTNISHYIWKEQIIPHNFNPLDEETASDTSGCLFGRFLEKVASPENKEFPGDRSKRVVDEARLESLITAIGYLTHTYQNPSLTKAVIFCEEKISRDDDANGRTGKGLTAYAISKLRKRVVYNGKQVDFNDKFFYQKITPDTQLIYFDDVKKNFDFESLFSVLTEGFSIEYKGMKPIEVPFDRTPKVLISTNSVLSNDTDSHRARKFEIEFSDYFSADYTPVNEFGQNFFEKGWSEDDPEWDRFFNFMLYCVKHYFNNSLSSYTPINLIERKLLSVMPEEFIEFADTLCEKMQKGERIYREKIYEDFISEYKSYAPSSKFAISQRLTTRWFNYYLKMKKIDFVETRDSSRGKRMRYWILSKYNINNEVSDDIDGFDFE